MKALIFNKGLAALIVSDGQRFLVSAAPADEGGFSVGIDTMRITMVVDENFARAKVREIATFYAQTIMEVN